MVKIRNWVFPKWISIPQNHSCLFTFLPKKFPKFFHFKFFNKDNESLITFFSHTIFHIQPLSLYTKYYILYHQLSVIDLTITLFFVYYVTQTYCFQIFKCHFRLFFPKLNVILGFQYKLIYFCQFYSSLLIISLNNLYNILIFLQEHLGTREVIYYSLHSIICVAFFCLILGDNIYIKLKYP